MTDKAKASEHDLREGSKPEVNELLKLEKSATPGPWKIIEGRQSDYPYSIHGNSGGRIIVWGGIARKSSAEGQANAKLIVAMRNQLAAILEENQRLQNYVGTMKKSTALKMLAAAEAENQRLAKELERFKALEAHLPKGYAIGDDATAELAVKLGKMREALEKIRGYDPLDADPLYRNAIRQFAGEAALAE